MPASTAPSPALAQSARITGRVLEAENRQPVQFVTVTLSDADHLDLKTAFTDSMGSFAFDVEGGGPFLLDFARIGYRGVKKRNVLPDPATTLIIVMVSAPYVSADTVFVTASRSPETWFEAPTSTSLLNRSDLEQEPVLTPVDPSREVVGLDFASKGILQHTYAVRGHRSVNSGALLVMSDFRYTGVPALDLNVPYLMGLSKDDIERVEIARGPGSALYGPNSDRGILHFITRSPLDDPGTDLSLAMGERGLLQGRLRHAGQLGTKLGFKLSGEYFQGDDWEYIDPEEQTARRSALDAGADPDTLRVGRRDNDLQRAVGEARVDWAPRAGSEWTVTAGLADAVNLVDLTPTLGGVQVKEWLYPYLQLRTRQNSFQANVFYNGSRSGDTYALRTGDPLVDESWLAAIQLQNRSTLGSSLLNYGVDARHTEPRTKGTINGRNEENDTMTELGAYLSANQPLGEKLALVGALRGDYHDRINDVTLSPRLGVMVYPTRAQSVRLTYNRAFSSPDAAALFLDARQGSLPLPYDIRASAVPKDGFTFDRDCDGGFCMQTPWAPLPPSLPADATLTWDVLMNLLSLQDLGIPAPDASQVGTDLRILSPDGGGWNAIRSEDVLAVPGPRRVIRNTLEAGYKAVLKDRATVSAEVYWTHIKDNLGPPRTITPNVFFNEEMLAAYLGSNGFSPEEADSIAQVASQIPMGTVAPDQVGSSSDILIVTHQVDDYTYTFWGVDLGLEFELNGHVVVGGDYSYFHDRVIHNVEIVGSVTPGVPAQKGAVWIRYLNQESGWSAGATGRAVGGFPVNSGVYRGKIDAYAVLDVNVGYRLMRAPKVALSLNAQNVFDDRHQEYVGAAELGRLVMLNLSVGF